MHIKAYILNTSFRPQADEVAYMIHEQIKRSYDVFLESNLHIGNWSC